MNSTDKILFIGLGFELELVLRHIIDTVLYKREQLLFTRKNKNKAELQSKTTGVGYSLDNSAALNDFHPDIVFIGVKAPDLTNVIAEIKKASWQGFHSLVVISTPVPYNDLQSIFPQIEVVSMVPDDYIDIKNPSNIINYCSSKGDSELIEYIFRKTCKKLVRLEPEQMNEFTVLSCQGNPVLNFLMMHYKDYSSEYSTTFGEFCSISFSQLAKLLKGEVVETASSIISQVAQGYKEVTQKLALDENLSKEVLSLTFDSMVAKKSVFDLPTEELRKTIKLWATVGGYEEKGIEVVEMEYKTCEGKNDFTSLPSKIVQAMVHRGKELESLVSNQLVQVVND